MSSTLSTPSSEASSSITTLVPYSKQRRVTRATIFLITLTLACCLLSSTTFAAPAAKPPSKNLLRQRSLVHQVHHVQVADESVHNTLVLLKKSIQKRKSQKRSQSPQQQHQVQQGHTTATTKEKWSKRHAKREIVDSSSLSASVPEDHTASNDEDVRVEVLADLDSIATTTTETHSSSSTSDDSSATVQHSNNHVQKKHSRGGAHHRARLLSAYESIIFSESQIPVFLTQDHHHQRFHRPQHHRQRKGANVSTKNNAESRHQNPTRAEASIPSVIPSSSGDDVAVAQADSPSSSSPSLDSGLEQQHATTSTVAQDTFASNNNNLQTDHVAEDEIIAVGVTGDQPSENDDKNSSLLFAAASTSPILQVEQDKGDSTVVPPSIATEEGASEPFSSSSSLSFASAGSIEAVAVGNEPSQSADSPTEEEVVETVAVVEDESSGVADEIEDGWVTITNADLADSDSDSSSNIDSNPSSSVEFQSPAESDDIPLSDNTAPTHHHQRNTGTSLFHNGCSSSIITLLGGLLLTVIGLVYRFHIRKQQLQKQQARRLGSSLPLDAKAPLSTKSSEEKSSVHRLSVDSVAGLKREGDSGRTTAMRDYVGFNVQ